MIATKWKKRVTGTPGGMVADPEELRRGLRVFADPQAGCEIMALKSGRRATLAGSNIEELVKAAEEMPGGIGLYIRLNPVPPNLAHPANNGDIVKRRWLYIDIDPFKAVGQEDNPATMAEKQKASRVAESVLAKLTGLGWPAPVIMDSGNGWALFYRVELPNGNREKASLAQLMKTLSEEFTGLDGIVDKSVHNANRLTKLPGTWAKKGIETPERPFRVCRLLSVPEALEVLTLEQIEAVASVKDEKPKDRPPAEPHTTNGDKFTLRVVASGKGSYGKAALDKECARVSLCGAGNRNNTLNEAAFSLGQLVAGGELERSEVETRLNLAAISAGLDGSEIATTIRSGMNAGMKSPRVAPERPGQQPATPAVAAVKPGESIIYWASEVKTRAVEWLWPGRIPLGKLTTFAGVGGLGKTFVLCDITARITRGLEWPDMTGERATLGRVLFISGEDDPDDTLVPRMIEMGADLSRVAFLKTEVQDKFTMADLTTLEKALEAIGSECRLVVIDPPTAYLGGVNDHNNAELRGLLSPLKSLAAKWRVSLIFNTHVNKGGNGKVEAMMRVMGSVAWVNAVRAAYMFTHSPDDRERRLFIGMKNNLGPERKGMAYMLEASGALAKVKWMGEVDTTADEAVNQTKGKNRGESAAEWVLDKFREKREWDSETLFKMAAQEGYSRSAMFEAKKSLNLPRARRNIHENGEVVFSWWVPDDWPPLAGPQPEGIPL